MRNNRRLFCWGLMIALMVILSAGFATAGEVEKINDPLEISTVLQETGSVRVIVSFSVDSYDSLLATAIASSRTAAAADAGSAPTLQAAAQQAGTALASAIKTGVRQMLGNVSSGTVSEQHVFSTIPAAVLTVNSDGLHALESMAQVTHIEYDKKIDLPEPIAESNGLTPVASDYGTSLIGADQAWAQGYTGEGWYVAILDTGISTTHEFFAGKDILEACFTSRTEDNPDCTLCPNGEDNQTGAGAAAFRGSSSISGYDHGQHVAGIAAGHKSDDSLNGVAKSADIIAVNIFSDGYTESDGSPEISATFSDIIRGLEYVYSLASSHKIASVNMSLGGGQFASNCDGSYSSVKTVIDNLRSLNIATLVAAGNEYYCGSVSAPACISTAIAVGASNSSDVKADFSNWQTDMVPLFAPGVDITSATNGSDSSYESWNGTSMATPFVAGAWAVMRHKAPNASVDDILNALKNTAAHVTFTTCDSPTDINRRISVIDALNQFSVAASQADVLFHNTSSGRNAVWYLSGSSYVSFSMLTTTPSGWKIACTGDFNNDGETDILWRSDSGKTALWHMNGAELSDWSMLDATPSVWTPVGVGDCNQDGHADIYWQNGHNGKIAVWYMNDTTLSEIVYPGETQSPPWGIKGVADFNSDGNPDLLWRNTESGANQIWLMNGITRSDSVDIQNAGTEWSIAGTGDFNDDNLTDILWSKPANGANCIWYMNGTSYSSLASPRKATDAWEAQGVGIFH